MSSATYPRSTGSARGEARRSELLARVADDVAEHGLVGFSLRRAARAAGTTHKVLLYYFDGVDDLLIQVVVALRRRRIDRGLAAAQDGSLSLADRVRALWPVLTEPDSWVLDQAIGLALYDAPTYAGLARTASEEYLPTLVSMCPDTWSDARRTEVAQLVLATLRGFLVEWRTSGEDAAGVEAGYRALVRALDCEEAALDEE